MRALEPSKFLAETLKPYASGGQSGLPGLFDRYLLDPADSDDAAIEARMGDVKALWDKAYENTRYGSLCKLLSGEHDDACLSLQDPSERSRLAGEAKRKSAADGEKVKKQLAEWRELLADNVAQGGLDPNKRSTLERIAKQLGLDPQLVKTELDRAPVMAAPDVLTPPVRDQVRKSLALLARDVGEERLALSLYHALGLEGITEDLAAVRRRYDAVDEENRRRAHGSTANAYKTVLANVKLYLLDSDPRAYIEGLVVDVGDAMDFEAARAGADGTIDATEAEALLQKAMSLGLTNVLARRLVSELARQFGAGLETGAVVDYVSCPACNTPHARSGAPKACKRCGTALFVVCPGNDCGTLNDATAARCTACGTDLHKFAEATRRLAGLPDALEEGRVAWAASELTEIAHVLGAASIPADLRGRVDRLIAEADGAWTLVESSIAGRRLYAARSALGALVKTAGDVVGPTGDRPLARSGEVDRRLAEVDRALARARAASGSAREAALVDAVGLAEDCEEAVSALAAIDPEPPGTVTVSLGQAGPVVRWRASTTAGVRYVVRRIDARTQASTDVAASSATRLEDADAPIGANVRYEVAAARGRTTSLPVTSDTLLVAREVQDLTVADVDGEVRLAWQAVPASARVIVRRTAERSGAETALIADRTGLTDRDVENGERYAYVVCVEYAGPGGAGQRTAGVTIYGQPSAPPEGIEALSIRSVPGGVLVTFDRPPTGTVSILRCDAEPTVSPGDSLDPAALTSVGRALTVGADGARDSASSGVCWYLPVTVAGGTAIAGRAVRHLALAAIDNVAAVESPGQIRVTWEWPAGVRIAKVIWRTDRQPSGPDDAEADSAWVRLGEYRDGGGFTIATGGPTAIFIAVVPAIRADGELVAGTSIAKGARAALRPSSKSDLRYCVSRTGGLRKKRLQVTVEAPAGVSPPGLVLVARGGDLLPRTSGDGDPLGRLGGGEPLRLEVDLSGRGRPMVVRLFLESASSASSFQLFDPSPDDLLIR